MKLQSIVQSQDNGVFKDADGGIPQGEHKEAPPTKLICGSRWYINKITFTLQVKQLAHPC
jgi:hypothetical protein